MDRVPLKKILDAEAYELYKAQRYLWSPERLDMLESHFQRKFATNAGEVRNVSILVAFGVNEG